MSHSSDIDRRCAAVVSYGRCSTKQRRAAESRQCSEPGLARQLDLCDLRACVRALCARASSARALYVCVVRRAISSSSAVARAALVVVCLFVVVVVVAVRGVMPPLSAADRNNGHRVTEERATR